MDTARDGAPCGVAAAPPLRTFIADTFTAIMTLRVYHATRCRVIKATWTLFVPSTHYRFYSDVEEKT